MNRFLLIASTLAFLGNFGNCAPPVLPTRITKVFHLDYENFKEDVDEKAKFYARNTTEDLFLDALAGIIQKTYLATDEIICYVDKLKGTSLTQFVVQIPRFIHRNFPDDEQFNILIGHKENLTESLTELMYKLTPVNEINKQLWTMLKNDMNANTKIAKGDFSNVKKVAITIRGYTRIFEDKFKDFKMLELLKHFNEVADLTENFKYGKTLPTKAVEELKEITNAVNKIVPKMMSTVKFMSTMDYDDLYKSQKNFLSLVMNALGVKIFFGGKSFKSFNPNQSISKY